MFQWGLHLIQGTFLWAHHHILAWEDKVRVWGLEVQVLGILVWADQVRAIQEWEVQVQDIPVWEDQVQATRE